jgi:acryloyl-coenzyme A reductase
MKAVVCEAFGGPEVLHLREVPNPPPPGPGEVQVRIAARGVQYVDVLMLAGKRPPARSSRSGRVSPMSSSASWS